MDKETKEKTIKLVDFRFEMICDDMGYWIDIVDIPNLDYMIEQLVESTGSTKEKVIEGLENWKSGVYRRNG